MIILPLLTFIIVFLVASICIYNGLVRKRNGVRTAFSSIDVMLKKRCDLIPNLVASVKEYMKHESELLTQITELREKTRQAQTSGERLGIESQLTSALGQLSVSFENYPDLKANQNVLQLQAALNEVEEQISAARRMYNNAVNALNNGVESFPGNIFASMFGFTKETFFEATESERSSVNVSNLFNQ